MIHDPPVLLLDEPTLGLDPHFSLQMRNKIRELGKTVILTTHYMEEADFLSDRVGILHRGHLVAEGTPAELKSEIERAESPTLTDVFIKLTTEI
jgi:ABC-2 type transport system ATP-binding protein